MIINDFISISNDIKYFERTSKNIFRHLIAKKRKKSGWVSFFPNEEAIA